MDGLIHFFKHLIGLCGEAHPSVIMGGGIFLTTISVYFRQIVDYIKGIWLPWSKGKLVGQKDPL